MPTALTRGQQAVYDFLCDNEDWFEHPPTLEELCEYMGLSSKGSMHKHIQALITAGLVEPMDRKHRGVRLTGASLDDDGSLPFMGYIAAGAPIEALENPQMMEVPLYLQGNGENYVLQVRGDSMIDEGIFDGDWVVIEKRSSARNGEIVVALVENQDATLKRIEQKPGKVILHPANSAMKPMRFKPDQVQIQGILVAQMRKY